MIRTLKLMAVVMMIGGLTMMTGCQSASKCCGKDGKCCKTGAHAKDHDHKDSAVK